MTTGTSVFQRRTHAYDRMQPACRMHTIVRPPAYVRNMQPAYDRMQAAYDTSVCRLHAYDRMQPVYERMQAAYDRMQAACVPSVAPAQRTCS